MKNASPLTKMSALMASMGIVISTQVFALPPLMNSNGIDYITGGVGLEESTEIKAIQSQWPLTLQFAQTNGVNGEHIADVNVSIVDNRGREVMTAFADAPYLLAKLPPGRYNVNATHKGMTMKKTVVIQSGKPTQAMLLWRAS